MEPLLGYLLIFVARVTDVSLGTVRLLMVVRGKRLLAAAIGFIEVLIFITALSRVVSHLDQVLNIVAYALGFATGNYVGSWVEERMALGYCTVQAIPSSMELAYELSEKLRAEGYGVTALDGHGRQGPRQLLVASCTRRTLSGMLQTIEQMDPHAFITVLDTRSRVGGVFFQRKGK
ncbi:MAG: DUF2179 domain-containing protein [Bacillota bacterium]